MFRKMGPGVLVAAAFIGPGTVTACTLAGVGFGFGLVAFDHCHNRLAGNVCKIGNNYPKWVGQCHQE